MRLLLDNNLSPRLTAALKVVGFDVEHVRDLGLRSAADEVVMETARVADRILVSADTDFGHLLARSSATSPSVVLIRRVNGRRIEQLVNLLLANLPALSEDLALGSIVVLTEDSVRIRRLPLR